MVEQTDLMKRVIEVDNELIQKGVEPFARPGLAHMMIAQRLQPGSSSILKNDPLSNAVNQIYNQLYRSSDLHMPPMHVGAFMFRDVFFPIKIPLICGSSAINPVDLLTDVPEIQKQWLFSEQQSGLTFFDQVIDLMDFVYGLQACEGLGQLRIDTVEYWYLAKRQLEAAAATILNSFDKYTVIQNCYISTELLLKGALIASIDPEVSESDVKKRVKELYGHKLEKLVYATAEQLPDLDRETMLFVVKELPDYVKSRYEAKTFSRVKLGEFLMNTQFVGGEILRQFSKRNSRADFAATPDENWNLAHRTFPKQIK